MGTIIKWLAVIFIGLFIIGKCTNSSKAPSNPSPTAPSVVAPKLSPEQHLLDAQKIYDQIKDQKPENISVSQLLEMRRHLNEIPASASQFSEVKKLAAKLDAITKKVDAYLANQVKLAAVTNRETAAQAFEKIFLDSGMDVYVSVRGKQKDVLHMRYIFCSRPFIHKLQNTDNLIQNLRSAGFKRVECNNGYDERWWLDL